KRVRRTGRDTDLRQWLLIRSWNTGDVVKAVKFAGIGKTRLGPGPLDDVEDLGEAVAALLIGHLVGVIGADDATAPDAEDQPTMADLVDRRGLLGKAQRVAERQHLHGDADLHSTGAGGDRAGDRERRRQISALRREMDFGQPHDVEAPTLGGVDLRHRLVKHLRLAAARHRRKLVKHAKFHRRSLKPFVSRLSPGYGWYFTQPRRANAARARAANAIGL